MILLEENNVYNRNTYMSIAGGLAKTAENVVKMNADTMQIFSRNPRGSSYKTYLHGRNRKIPEDTERSCIRSGSRTCTVYDESGECNGKNYEFACTVIREDIRRMDELQIENLVFHPGSHTGIGEEAGITNIIRGLDQAITGSENITVLSGNDEWKRDRDRIPV